MRTENGFPVRGIRREERRGPGDLAQGLEQPLLRRAVEIIGVVGETGRECDGHFWALFVDTVRGATGALRIRYQRDRINPALSAERFSSMLPFD